MSHAIKSLKNKISTQEMEILAHENDIKKQKKEIARLAQEIRKSREQVRFLENTRSENLPGAITAHALLRFLERKYGLGSALEEAKKTLIAEIDGKIVAPNCRINITDGLQVIVKNGYIVTIQPQ